MAEMSVGYSREDKEVETFTNPGIAVITAPSDIQVSNKPPQGHLTIFDVPKDSPSPILAERSDDEDSDHGSDPYAQHMKGRVSPSPYTANTERARQFNTYVRSVIEEKLDTLIPISHQPRDLIQQIITDASLKFPEFSSSVRKRIRTYLKSYRRSKRVKDMQAAAAIAQQYGSPNGVSVKEKDTSPLINIASITLPNELISTQSAAIVTINANTGHVTKEDDTIPPIAKKPRLATISEAPPSVPKQHIKSPPSSSNTGFSTNEVSTLKQLIQGYRESAAFLNRAADQLEEMLAKETSNSVI